MSFAYAPPPAAGEQPPHPGTHSHNNSIHSGMYAPTPTYSPVPSPAAAISTPVAAGGPASSSQQQAGSISSLVQALQAGNISRQDLYASLNHMYQGQKGGGGSGGMATPATSASFMHASSSPSITVPSGAPSPSSSSFNAPSTSFSLHAHTPSAGGGIYTPTSQAHTPLSSSFQQTPMQQQQSQQQQQQSHQQQPFSTPQQQFPSFQTAAQQPFSSSFTFQQPLTHPAPPSSSSSSSSAHSYSASDHAAAQQAVQAFLAKRMGGGGGNHASNLSSASLNQSSFNLGGQMGNNTSLDLSHATNTSLSDMLQHTHLQGQGQGLHPSAAYSPVPPLHMSGLGSSMEESYMQHQSQQYNQQQQQQQQQQFQQTPQAQYSYHTQQQQYDQQQQQQYQQQYEEEDGEPREYNPDDYASSRASSVAGGGRGGPHSARGQGTGAPGTKIGARMSVRERMSQVYTEEKNAELTFRPNIRPLPKHLYGGRDRDRSRSMDGGDSASQDGSQPPSARDAPFLGRVMHWSENKKARERALALEAEKRALEECTFKPVINDESVAIVTAPGATHRRLFSARSMARAKIVELEVRRKEEEEFRKHCSFQPELNKKSLEMAANLAVRVRPSTAAATLSSQLDPPDLAECTFKPHTNAPKPHMVAAQLYLEQDPFQRLASTVAPVSKRGRSTSRSNSQNRDGYESEGTTSYRGHTRGRSHTRSSSVGRGGVGGGSRSARSHSTDPENRSTSRSRAGGPGTASFDEFLARLKFKEYQRAEKLEALKVAEQQEVQYGRPLLSKKSAKIIRQSIEAGTYQSPTKRASVVAAQATEGAHSLDPVALAQRSDPECTFAPTIHPYSRSLSHRSVEEMSTLEMARRAHNMEIKVHELVQKEMEQASFRPHVKQIKGVSGRLKVLSEPDLYVERLQFQSKVREAEIARQRRLREQQEMEACTWTPAVHEAPEFVKKMARARSMERLMRPKEQQEKKKKGKPEWQ